MRQLTTSTQGAAADKQLVADNFLKVELSYDLPKPVWFVGIYKALKPSRGHLGFQVEISFMAHFFYPIEYCD